MLHGLFCEFFGNVVLKKAVAEGGSCPRSDKKFSAIL